MSYDNASSDTFYHYADSGPEEDEPGYISTGTLEIVQQSYEQPLPRQTFEESEVPQPPRRPSSVSYPTTPHEASSYSTTPRQASSYSTTPSYATVKPKPPPIELIPSRRHRHYGVIGLIGLVGLVGLAKKPAPSNTTQASVAGGCLPGSVVYFAGSTLPSGYLLADGSSFNPTEYPVLASALGSSVLPNLIDRYPRGSASDVGTLMDSEIDVSNLMIEIDDSGHSHIDGAGYSVQRDGQYTLAHLYSFDTDGMNLKDSASIVRPSTCGISARLVGGGTETRPSSTKLLPIVCIG